MCYPASDTTLPCGDCPAGFSRCAGRCWHLSSHYVDHPAAAQYCANLGAHLATPRTEEEYLCLLLVAEGFRVIDTFCLGYQSCGDVFVGADGCGPLTYSKWLPNEPALHGDEICVVYRTTTDDGWLTDLCNSTLPAICQTSHCYQPVD